MKLSKQERIAVIVIAILIILVVGVFVFIKPNIETINATQATLDSKKVELDNAKAKAATKDSLKEQILTAYDKGKNTADMFFPEMKSYEVDNEVRAFLEQCETEVLVESLSVSQPTTASLSTSVFVPPSVSYALKDYVNQGVTTDITKIDPNLIRQVLIQTALGEAQTIGASTASFTVKVKTKEELFSFADEVNDYVKNENGKDTRKAVGLDTISFNDKKLAEEYQNRAKNENDNTPGQPTTPPNAGDNNNSNNDNNNNNSGSGNEGNDESEFYEVDVTMTFYSIERMQDPTDRLDKQDIPASEAPPAASDNGTSTPAE